MITKMKPSNSMNSKILSNRYLKGINCCCNFKKHSIVLVALILITTVIPFSGCSSNAQTHKRTSSYVEDSDWFDNEVYTLDSNIYNSGGMTYHGDTPIIYADKSQVVIWEEYQYFDNGTEETKIQIGRYELGSNGEVNCNGVVDMVETGLVWNSDDQLQYSGVSSQFYFNDKVYCHVAGCDENGSFSYLQELDLDNNSLGEIINNETTEMLFNNGECYVNTIWSEGNQLNMIVSFYDSKTNKLAHYSHIRIDENFEIVAEDSFMPPDKDLPFIRIYTLDKDYFIGETVDYTRNTYDAYLVDRVTYSVTPIVDNISDYYLYDWHNFDGNMIATDRYKVVVFDGNEYCARPIFSFDNCNVDHFKANVMNIAYADEDVSIFWCCEGKGNFQFWKFTRAESNPNVGKEIIRLVDFCERPESDVARAIYEYNEGDNEGYIVYDDRYDLNGLLDMTIDDYNYQNTEEYADAVRNARTELSYKIRIDIMAGDGPDILIGAYDYSEFNNEQTLVDLRSSLNVDQSLYINPIFEGDDPIYQLPLKLTPTGVMWEFDYVDGLIPGQGFSYDDYNQYINNAYLGKDPISEKFDRANYFVTLFNYSYSHFISDGSININNDEFKAMAEFANSRIDDVNNENMPSYAYYTDKFDFYSINKGVLTALPSAEGNNGVMLTCDLSVAVAASCPNEKAAVGFVETLMNCYSKEIEREKLRSEINEYRDYQNSYIDRNIGYPLFDYLTEESYIRDNLADEYISLMDNANGIIVSDSDISVILYEEMQAYFVGEKPIEDVIPIIENRIQTVLGERA